MEEKDVDINNLPDGVVWVESTRDLSLSRGYRLAELAAVLGPHLKAHIAEPPSKTIPCPPPTVDLRTELENRIQELRTFEKGSFGAGNWKDLAEHTAISRYLQYWLMDIKAGACG